MTKAAIGIDVGGTSIKLGLVDPKGRILCRDSFLTFQASGRAALLNKLIEHVQVLRKEAHHRKLHVSGVGIGVPGPIDVERGFVYFFPNIPGWKNTPLKAILSKRLKLPIFIDNDANAMAFAEARYGAGRGAKNVIALTLGTGLGGGIVMNGKLFHGPHFSAAEIGHMTIDPNGPLCACGNRGCIETFVGNRYFIREARRRLKMTRGTILHKWLRGTQRELTPLLVQEAAFKGDALAKDIWRVAGDRLGTALAGLVNILNPELIIIGGGLAQSGRLIFGPVRSAIKKKAFPIASRFVKVLPAKLGMDAGVIGAAALVFSEK